MKKEDAQKFLKEADEFVKNKDVKVAFMVVADNEVAINFINGPPEMLLSIFKSVLHRTPNLINILRQSVIEAQYEVDYQNYADSQNKSKNESKKED